jgi:hypothetical protein
MQTTSFASKKKKSMLKFCTQLLSSFITHPNDSFVSPFLHSILFDE